MQIDRCGFQSPRRLSMVRVSSRRPLLRWSAPPGAGVPSVDLCADRACTQPVATATVDSTGTSARPDADLPAGVVFWRVRTRTGAGERVSSTWEFAVGKNSAPLDTSGGCILDVDGDGKAELLVGAPQDFSHPSPAPVVELLFGGARATLGASRQLLRAPSMDELFGFEVASAGDLNGDGFGDVVVSAESIGAGSAYVYWGGPAGLDVDNPQRISVDNGSRVTVACAGDINLDGYGDLLVGGLGNAQILFGGPSGIDADTVSFPVEGVTYHPTLPGVGTVAAGDLDGDGYTDVVIGELDRRDGQGISVGRVLVYLGSAGGVVPQQPLVLDPPGADAFTFGRYLHVSDVDGDGRAELFVSMDDLSTVLTSATARVFVFRGAPGGPDLANPQVLLGLDASRNFGVRLASGDIDSDGYLDLIVGSNGSGELFAFPGSAGGIDPARRWLVTGGHRSFGLGVGCGGDVDGDGFDDVIVSAPYAPDAAGVANVGSAWLYWGGRSGVEVEAATPIIPSTNVQLFGFSVY